MPARIGLPSSGCRADLARQAQQAQRLFQVHRRRRPALGQAGALGLLAFAPSLDVGAEAAGLQEHGLAGHRVDAQLAVAASAGLGVAVRLGQRAGEAAFRIVRAADEGAELAGLQRSAGPSPQVGQARGSAPSSLAGKMCGPQRLVQGVEHVGDAQLGDLADGGVEVGPELAQQHLPVEVAGRDLVELLFQARR